MVLAREKGNRSSRIESRHDDADLEGAEAGRAGAGGCGGIYIRTWHFNSLRSISDCWEPGESLYQLVTT